MSADKMIIAVTGKTKSGKSLACSYLAEAGYKVIDIDRFAHSLYSKGTPLWKRLIKIYGEQVLCRDGNIDRSKLGKLAFSSEKTYIRFTNIVYPYLVKSLRSEIARHGSKTVVLDFAVLFETGFDRLVDRIIFVTLKESIWKKRIRACPNAEFLLKAAKFQETIPASKKIALSDYIIYNNSSRKALKKGILEAIFLITKGKNGPGKKGKYR